MHAMPRGRMKERRQGRPTGIGDVVLSCDGFQVEGDRSAAVRHHVLHGPCRSKPVCPCARVCATPEETAIDSATKRCQRPSASRATSARLRNRAQVLMQPCGMDVFARLMTRAATEHSKDDAARWRLSYDNISPYD
jgi:hypothetical protein